MTNVTVIGLGYIGLPTAAVLAGSGHRVRGFDVNRRILDRLRAGEIHIEEPGLGELVKDVVARGSLAPSETIEPSDAFIVCVPTPFDRRSKRADLSYVESAAKALVPVLKRGDLVILESTVPVGTTGGAFADILATSGLDPERDLDVVHCPETVLPGRTLTEIRENTRIVGGMTPRATAAARALYASFVTGPIVETNDRTAEFVKLAENASRDAAIAFANEAAQAARLLGVDAREAIAIANRHPRVSIPSPGPGVGGHCIPVDPWFLIGENPGGRIMRAARDVNDGMPAYVVDLVEEALKGVASPRIAVLGIAYKANVDDVRESPALEVVHLLRARRRDATVVVADPHAPERENAVPTEEALAGADCLVLLTDHDEFRALDPEGVAKRVRTRIAVDARGALPRKAWEAAGFRMTVL